MKNAFEIEEGGVKERGIWREQSRGRERCEQGYRKSRGTGRASLLLQYTRTGQNEPHETYEPWSLFSARRNKCEYLCSGAGRRVGPGQSQISGQHDRRWHRVYWNKGLTPLPNAPSHPTTPAICTVLHPVYSTAQRLVLLTTTMQLYLVLIQLGTFWFFLPEHNSLSFLGCEPHKHKCASCTDRKLTSSVVRDGDTQFAVCVTVSAAGSCLERPLACSCT